MPSTAHAGRGRCDEAARWREHCRQAIGLDLRSLALYRVALATLILFDLADRARDLRAHYTDSGVVPRQAIREVFQENPVWSLHSLAGRSELAAGAVFGLNAFAALGLMLGWRTRLMTAACWLLACSLHRANPAVLTGGDQLLRLLLFWSLFLPLGARASIDARNRSKRIVRSGEDSAHGDGGQPDRRARPPRTSTATRAPVPPRARRGTCAPAGAAPASGLLVSVPGLCFILQLCIVYWFTAAMKSGSTWWPQGTALKAALSIESIVFPLGVWLRQQEALLAPLTYATLWLEWLGPLLIFAPGWNAVCRTLAIASFLAFHACILVTMEVGIFSQVCMVAWLALVPGWWWERSSEPAGGAPRRAHWLASTLAGVALAYVLSVNAFQLMAQRQLPGAGILGRLLRPAFPVGGALMLDQRWSMFAPDPWPVYAWCVFEGQRADGAPVDPFRDGGPVSFERPASIARSLPTSRWRVYFTKMPFEAPRERGLPHHLARYLLDEWNRRHAGDSRLTRVTVYKLISSSSSTSAAAAQIVPLAESSPRSD